MSQCIPCTIIKENEKKKEQKESPEDGKVMELQLVT
jgi:hypothetical protein